MQCRVSNRNIRLTCVPKPVAQFPEFNAALYVYGYLGLQLGMKAGLDLCKCKNKIGHIFFFKIILFSIFVIFNNFHKQHKCNNRLTNNSINNCSFCFLFYSVFSESFQSIDVMLEPKKNGRHQGLTSRPRAQRTDVHCSRV